MFNESSLRSPSEFEEKTRYKLRRSSSRVRQEQDESTYGGSLHGRLPEATGDALFSRVCPDPIELEDHVPVYIPEPEYPKDLVPAKDEAPTPLLPPFFLSPRIRPLSPRALEVEMREANTPPRKRLLLTTPRPGCEVGESSAAAAARQPGPTMAHRVDHSHVDTMETRFRDIERRMMTALEMVNMRVSYQLRLRRERLAYEQESMETRQALARSEAHCRALEARVTVLETEVRRHEWQRQAADDLAVQYIMRTQALEAGARVDTLEDTGSSS
ncbi:hypothetical protein Tco_1419921 [Tanacetum coccineum]